MVKSAYSSGKPAYGVGAGNATMVIDETADIVQAARNTAISKTNDTDRAAPPTATSSSTPSIYDAFLQQLQAEGGYLVNAAEKALLEKAYWDADGHRTATPSRARRRWSRGIAGFAIPATRPSCSSRSSTSARSTASPPKSSGPCSRSSSATASTTRSTRCGRLFETGGKGTSCGIYSHDDDHIHRLALVAPVSRMMVRQVQSSSNAGTFTNGMPMTSSMGCGVWGGNITNENISLKHYMNVTWVSRPIAEDRPSEQELFGEFYDSETF
jgi:NAD-dependent aldehyde dehydrogenases